MPNSVMLIVWRIMGEDCQNCSVIYHVLQLYIVMFVMYTCIFCGTYDYIYKKYFFAYFDIRYIFVFNIAFFRTFESSTYSENMNITLFLCLTYIFVENRPEQCWK